jgi:hypothetical protein
VLETLREAGNLDLHDFFTFVVGNATQDLDAAPYGGARFRVGGAECCRGCSGGTAQFGRGGTGVWQVFRANQPAPVEPEVLPAGAGCIYNATKRARERNGNQRQARSGDSAIGSRFADIHTTSFSSLTGLNVDYCRTPPCGTADCRK